MRLESMRSCNVKTLKKIKKKGRRGKIHPKARVLDACADFLQLRLTPNNVLGIRHFAESLGKVYYLVVHIY